MSSTLGTQFENAGVSFDEEKEDYFQVPSCKLFPTWDTGFDIGAWGQAFGSKSIELWPELDPHLSPKQRKVALNVSPPSNCDALLCGSKTTWKRPATDNRHLENWSPSDDNMAVGLNACQVLTEDDSIRSEEDQNSLPSYRNGVAAIQEIPCEEVTHDWLPISLAVEQVFGDMDKILLLIAKEN